MLIQLQKMVHCLRKMQQVDSEQYNQQLEDICLNVGALYHFKTILTDSNIEGIAFVYFLEPTKKMAAIFLKNYFTERYSDFDEVFFVQLVMGIVMDQKLSYKYKILMEETIINMLEWVQKENLSQIIDCLHNAFFCLQRASGRQFLSLEQKNIKKRSNLDATKLNLKKYYQPNIQSEAQFLNLGYSLIHFVECFTSVNSVDSQDLHRVVRISLTVSLTIFPMKNAQSWLRLQMVILHMWLGYMEMIETQKEKRTQLQLIQQEIFEQEYLWTKISEVYEFAAFNFTGLQGEDNLFVCSSQQPQKKIINKMKNYACQIHLKLLQYETDFSQTQSHIKKTTALPMLTRTIKTISYFSIQKHMLYMCSCQQFVNSLLTLFIYVCKQNPQIIDANWSNLFHLIIFPLLTMDEKEKRSFDEEPQEYCRLAEDCCDRQHLGELKTEAARFLEIVSDRSLVYCQYAVQFCCVSLQAVVFKNEIKVQNTIALLPFEAAFMTLSVLSYNLNRFQLQAATIRSVLLSPQCQKLTQIQASRVFLFLAYNYSQVFKTPLEGKMWINNAMNSNMHHTTRIAALDFLLNIVDEYFEEEFLIMFSEKIVNDVEIRQVWDVLNKLLNNHLHKVNEQPMVILIQRILQRMSEDIVRYKDKKIKTTANINSGLQLMRKILSNHTYSSIKPNVLQQILKVIPLYKTFKQINLQDVILKIINEFMQLEDTISEHFQEKLAQIDLVEEFRQQGYRPTPFYWIWNQYIFKEQNFEKIRDIKSLLVEGLKSLYQQFLCDKKKVKTNLPIAHSLLIIQHILTLHGQKFSNQQIYQIYNLCTIILPEDINEPQRLNLAPTIVGRTLIVLMVCYMLRSNQQKGEKMNALKYLLLYHDQQGVFTGHNTQVIVKLLCKQLFRQSDLVSVTQMINIMIRILRPTHKQPSQHKQKKISKKSMKFKIKSTQNYEVILKKIRMPLDFKISSEQQLRTTLTTMKENNELLYKSIISYLPTIIKDKLRDLLATSSVGLDQEGYSKTRRIMKIGGVKKDVGYNESSNSDGLSGSRKRDMNFDLNEDSQVYEEIDENELVLENLDNENESNFDEKYEEKKGKMKKNKIMKKLKVNQQSMHQEKQQKYQ